MKIQFLLVGALCVLVKGQNYAFESHGDYVPVIKGGVPVDTPEVQAAKAAHFEAVERARVLAAKNPSNGQYEESIIPRYQQQQHQQVNYQQQHYRQPYQQQQYQSQAYQPQQYQQQAYQPQRYQQQAYQGQRYQGNGIYSQPKQQQYTIASYSSALPIDTPEVQQARAAHLAAYSQAQTHHYRTRRGIYIQGPQETPEVQAAKYQHLVAHASAHDEDDDDFYPAQDHDYFHVPIITKKGVPVTTGAVKAARQQHLLAVQLAKAGVQYSGGHSVYRPVIAPNGVPYDTPEVYIAKAEHLAAHAKESTKQNQWGLYSGYGGSYDF